MRNPASLLEVVHPEDRPYALQHYEQLCAKEDTCDLEFRIVLSRDVTKSVRVRASSLANEAGVVCQIVGFAEDVTWRRQYEMSLFDINSRKDAVLAILSHDLSGPLAMIQTIAGLLEREHEKKQFNEVRQFTDLIQRTCKRSTDLIEDLINQEFLESSNVELNRDRIELVSRVRSVIETFQASSHDIQKQFRLKASNEPLYALIDDVKFMQVINNLISNAIKFTYDQGIIAITLKEKKKSVLITVQDNGIGIPAAVQPLLFDKFTKARRPGLRGEKTVGLGMSIIRTIVELHGGKIWFKSVENKGSTFFVEIPKE